MTFYLINLSFRNSLLRNFGVEVCSLLKGSPNGHCFNHGAQQCSFELVQEMIILVKKNTPFCHFAGYRELYLIRQSIVNDGIDQDIPCTLFQPIFNSDKLKRRVVFVMLNQLLHDPYHLSLIRDIFASNKIKISEGDEVDFVQLFSSLSFEVE